MNPLTEGHVGTSRGQGLSFFTPLFDTVKVLLGGRESALEESLHIDKWRLESKVKVEGALESLFHFEFCQVEIWGALGQVLTENLILRHILWSFHTNLIRRFKSLLCLHKLIWAQAFLLARGRGHILIRGDFNVEET